MTILSPQLKRENVVTDLHLEEDLPQISLDRERLQQVFMILLKNALGTMEGKDDKSIAITTETRINYQGQRSIRTTISDRGHGIKEENLRRIFDPFFTTRDPGKGMGIGLSIAYRTIEDQGDKICAENNEWGGAAFHFELPVVVQRVTP